jgi:hypothetical protein
MECKQFQRRMNQLLDRRVRPDEDERLRSHTLQCADCRALLALQQVVFAALAEAPGPLPPRLEKVPVPPSVVGRPWLAGDPNPKALPSTADKGRQFWAGLALVLTLLLGLAPWRLGPPTSASDGRSISSAPLPTGPTGSTSSLSTQMAATANGAAGHRSAWAIASPLSWGVVASHVELIDEDRWWKRRDATSRPSWWQPVEEGLGPLAQTLTSALNVLRSTWPLSRAAGIGSAADSLPLPTPAGASVQSS